MRMLTKSLLTLLLHAVVDRLQHGGQFLTVETLRDEVSHLVAEWLHSPDFEAEVQRLLVAVFRPQ